MNIVHIHIGKCAGGSLNKIFLKKNISFTQFHCGDALTELKERLALQDPEDHYVITIRDPIDRFISAFNYDKYEKIISLKRKNKQWNEIYNEFECVDDLIGSFDSDSVSKNRKKIAIDAVFASNLHMHMGVSYYLDIPTINKLPKSKTFLIRTESFTRDLVHFSEQLRLNITDNDIVSDKNSSSFLDEINIENPKYLSDVNRVTLGKILFTDYIIIERLEQRFSEP